MFAFKSNDESTKDGLRETGAWKKMLGPGPHLVLQKATDDRGTEVVFGVFFQGQMPELPAVMPDVHEENDYAIQEKPGDFAFFYTADSFAHYKPSSSFEPHKIFVTYNSCAVTLMGDFVVLCTDTSLESEFDGAQEDPVTQVMINGVGFNQQAYERCMLHSKQTEVWTLDLSDSDSSGKNQSAEEAETDSQQPKLSQLCIKVKHPWVMSNSALNHYRSEPIYHVPAHLKVQQAV